MSEQALSLNLRLRDEAADEGGAGAPPGGGTCFGSIKWRAKGREVGGILGGGTPLRRPDCVLRLYARGS